MNDAEEPLSPRGQRRREQILANAVAEAKMIRGRRQRLRFGATAGAALFLVVCVAITARHRAPTPEASVTLLPRTTPAPTPLPLPSSAVIIDRIHSDAELTARLALPPTAPKWRFIGDDELLHTLADAGHPAGLVRMNGQAMLLER
jgi:hypothetical protein